MPERLFLSPASQHDLSALRKFDPQLEDCGLSGDKAYADTETRAALQERRVYLVTPYKRNEEKTVVPGLFNRFVSRIRQPIESLFGWLIQRADLG
ncbi:MAG TPA: hypothetical protein VNN73_23505 [Blastocatellia bacterium]|nr:hypothetical protein [Blastocatellia bacterium]